VHVSSAEDMLYKLQYLKENKLSLEELSKKLIDDTCRTQEELQHLKKLHNMVRFNEPESEDGRNVREFEEQVAQRKAKVKSRINKMKDTEKLILTALGLLGKIYSQVVGEVHTTTSNSLQADCERIARTLIEFQSIEVKSD